MRLRSYGDRAVIVDLDDAAAALRWTEALRRAEFPGVADVVPAARTVLVVAADGTEVTALTQMLEQWARQGLPFEGTVPDRVLDVPSAPVGAAPEGVTPEQIVVEVRYDGPDLAEVAALTGLGVRGVVAAHTRSRWRVAFGGFAPGFAYLVGGDPRLEVPRREHPRTAVPAGAVGLAGEYSGVYPRSSPGGWQLIGTTDAVLWDLERDPPALLRPGAVVRFVEVGR